MCILLTDAIALFYLIRKQSFNIVGKSKKRKRDRNKAKKSEKKKKTSKQSNWVVMLKIKAENIQIKQAKR